jgi:hypothetical protein
MLREGGIKGVGRERRVIEGEIRRRTYAQRRAIKSKEQREKRRDWRMQVIYREKERARARERERERESLLGTKLHNGGSG